jgi:uncharacterized membrane protein YbhN (UPF0104 family)
VLAALGWTTYQLPQLVSSATAGAGELHELRWPWVAAAAVLGVAAVALYGELHRQLLVVGGARPGGAAVQSVSFAQNAIGNTVPLVGGAGALAYAVTGLRRRGVDGALAAWAVLAAGVLSVFCLVALGAITLTATGRLPLAGCALVITGMLVAGAGALLLARHPGAFRGAAAKLLPVRPSPRQWLLLLGAAVVPWLADVATLAAAAAAVPGSVPWAALVWGFLVVQGSIALQVLPGGAGLAEVGLLGVLLGSGVASGPAAGVVLVYRGCSWLLPSALGWLVYGAQFRRAPVAAGAQAPDLGGGCCAEVPGQQPRGGRSIARLDREERFPGVVPMARGERLPCTRAP